MKKISTLVTYGDVKYFVNKNNDTICKLDFIVNFSKLNVYELFGNEVFNVTCSDYFDDLRASGVKVEDLGYGYALFTVEGIARLSTSDTYDKVIGERIANTRAQAKAFNTTYKLLNKLDMYMYKTYSSDIFGAIDANFNAMGNAFNHIEELKK